MSAPSPARLPSTPRRPREHPIEVSARVELVKIAYAELTSGTIASTGAALAFSIVEATNGQFIRVWSWLGVVLAIAAVRVWLATAFGRTTLTPANSRQWGLGLVAATTATGLAWGTTAWLFPSLIDGGPLGAVHILVLAGITTGSARLLMPMRKGGLAYLIAIMGPVCLRYFAEADFTGAALGGCTVFFIVYMAQAMLRNHRTFSDALVLRFERESLAAELTAENARREMREAELREARERAESASRAKDEFLATISHEIRTPMNGVLGMLRVLKDTPVSPEQRSYLKTASDSAESLLLLLNDVLDFSKIEAGHLELEQVAFSPAETVSAVVDLMRTRARDKGLQLEVNVRDLPPAIISDSNRLRQVLLNLLGNAIKFTERGRVEIAATSTPRNAAFTTLEFTVTDTGIGIEPAALDRLFKPFSQVDTSMSRRYGGTGLGLAISQRIARAMGGTIRVESTPGKGSTFRFIVPCALADSRVPAQTAAPHPAAPSLRGRVLVVEDDAVNKQVIDLFLRKMNLTAVFAADGEAAISTATGQPFDVVLMDCQLPGIDGLEATRRIRQQVGNSLRIIALTANANTHARDACLAAGMNDFLSKPVRFEILADVLERNLPKR